MMGMKERNFSPLPTTSLAGASPRPRGTRPRHLGCRAGRGVLLRSSARRGRGNPLGSPYLLSVDAIAL